MVRRADRLITPVEVRRRESALATPTVPSRRSPKPTSLAWTTCSTRSPI